MIVPRFYALDSTRIFPTLKNLSAASALDFCLNLVKQTAPYAAAFKPNAAFFEVFGAEGWAVLKQVIECHSRRIESTRLKDSRSSSMPSAATLHPLPKPMPNLLLRISAWIASR